MLNLLDTQNQLILSRNIDILGLIAVHLLHTRLFEQLQLEFVSCILYVTVALHYSWRRTWYRPDQALEPNLKSSQSPSFNHSSQAVQQTAVIRGRDSIAEALIIFCGPATGCSESCEAFLQ